MLNYKIDDLAKAELVFVDLDGHSRDSALRFLAERIAENADLEAADIFQGLLEREALGSTGLGGGIAIPHCRMAKVKEPLLAVGIAPEGIEFEALDGKPVRVVFVLVTSSDDAQQNLQCLAAISRWAREPQNVSRVLEVPSAVAVIEALGGPGA